MSTRKVQRNTLASFRRKEARTNLGKVKVPFLLEALKVRGHLLQLGLKSKHLFMVNGRCAPRTMSTDRRLASGTSSSCARDTRRAGGCDWGEGRGGIG